MSSNGTTRILLLSKYTQEIKRICDLRVLLHGRIRSTALITHVNWLVILVIRRNLTAFYAYFISFRKCQTTLTLLFTLTTVTVTMLLLSTPITTRPELLAYIYAKTIRFPDFSVNHFIWTVFEIEKNRCKYRYAVHTSCTQYCTETPGSKWIMRALISAIVYLVTEKIDREKKGTRT